MSISATNTCVNPNCGKKFEPGHYGSLQLVCPDGGAWIKCKKCRGLGKIDGVKCPRCKNGRYYQTCRAWYRRKYAKTRKKPRGIPGEDLARIIEACKPDPFYQALVIVAYNSGLRKGELLGLTPSVVLDKSGKIRDSIEILGQWDDRTHSYKVTKTDEPRVAYILEPGREALARLLKRYKLKRDERIWKYSKVTAWRRFIKIQEKLRITNPETGRPFRMHDFRHAIGTDLYEATGDLKRVQEMLGHASIVTSAIYSQQTRAKIAANIDAVMKKKRGA